MRRDWSFEDGMLAIPGSAAGLVTVFIGATCRIVQNSRDVIVYVDVRVNLLF